MFPRATTRVVERVEAGKDGMQGSVTQDNGQVSMHCDAILSVWVAQHPLHLLSKFTCLVIHM